MDALIFLFKFFGLTIVALLAVGVIIILLACIKALIEGYKNF